MSVLNSAGKEVFLISPLEKIKRFIVLGSFTGKCISSGSVRKDETLDSGEAFARKNIEEFIQHSPEEILNCIEEYSSKVKKCDSLVLLLAICCTFENKNPKLLEFRRKAYQLLPRVCKTPTSLFHFIDVCEKICLTKYCSTGWNNLHKQGISNWYLNNKKLEYHITKYRNRNGYTHRDVLRLCHIKPLTKEHENIFSYICKGISEGVEGSEVSEYIRDFERLKQSDEETIIRLIQQHNFVREHIPLEKLTDSVFDELLKNMPEIALLRNLNHQFKDLSLVLEKIQAIKSVHPLHLLIALKTYSNGHGYLGNKTWNVDKSIVQSLDSKFSQLFKTLPSSPRKVCICLDVSGSMQLYRVAGSECLTCAEAGCALAMVLKKTYKESHLLGFSHELIPLSINLEDGLHENLRKITYLPFGRTDISLPFTWALEKSKDFDCFIVITDNETNANTLSPEKALNNYREKTQNYSTKLIVVSMENTGFSIANPEDKYMLDIAGFNGETIEVINDFIES